MTSDFWRRRLEQVEVALRAPQLALEVAGASLPNSARAIALLTDTPSALLTGMIQDLAEAERPHDGVRAKVLWLLTDRWRASTNALHAAALAKDVSQVFPHWHACHSRLTDLQQFLTALTLSDLDSVNFRDASERCSTRFELGYVRLWQAETQSSEWRPIELEGATVLTAGSSRMASLAKSFSSKKTLIADVPMTARQVHGDCVAVLADSDRRTAERIVEALEREARRPASRLSQVFVTTIVNAYVALLRRAKWEACFDVTDLERPTPEQGDGLDKLEAALLGDTTNAAGLHLLLSSKPWPDISPQ